MIEHRVGSIFEQPDLNILVHQANLETCFGAGLASIIKKKFVYAYEADCKTHKGDLHKLGTFSVGKPDKTPTNDNPIIVNLYSQTGLGKGRQTSYDALELGLSSLEKKLAPVANKYVLGIPYSISCGLAQGSWLVVSAIIKSVFDKSPLKVVICRLPSQPELESVFDVSTTQTSDDPFVKNFPVLAAKAVAAAQDHGTFVLSDEKEEVF